MGQVIKITQRELARIADYRPQERKEPALMRAAVAVILREGVNETEFLLMQRAKHENDPWSGQMAFPGGKIEVFDASPKHAAIREAKEEVGAELAESDCIGRLDDLFGLQVDGVYSVHVACFVFKPKHILELVGNHEVADMVWLPLSFLDDRCNAHQFSHPFDRSLSMPGALIDAEKDQVLWGLSLRMLNNLYRVMERPMRVLSDDELRLLNQLEGRSLSDESAQSVKARLTRDAAPG